MTDYILLDPAGVTSAIVGVGPFSFLLIQNLKRYKWFRNDWGFPGSVLAALLVGFFGLLAYGKLWDGPAMYANGLYCLTAGLAASAGYRVQKRWGLFEAAPEPSVEVKA